MFLGIDIGTSGVKALVIDEAGQVVAQSSAPLSVSRPHPLWSEQDGDDWWNASEAAVLGLDAKLRQQIQAIGLSGQMHGATLLGSNDKPLRPAILWNDGRSHLECEELTARERKFLSEGGNLVMPGFTAPKLEWVRKNEPETFEQTRMVLLPKDYVRLRMTGDFASDMSDSAGTLWLDVKKRDWSEALLGACSLSVDQMPKLFEGNEITGVLRAEIASAWGMEVVPVVGGGGDNAAGAVGVGVLHDGEALLSLGTSGVVFATNDGFRPNTDQAVHAFCHALPQRWHQMSVMLSAASCLDWVCSLTGAADVGALIAMAEAQGEIAIGEHFLPYLSGERTPHNDPYATGVFSGLTFSTNPARLAQSVLEGVALGLADGVEAIRASGTDVTALSVIGGGAQPSYWGRILAAALNCTLVYREGSTFGPALGAARLAQSALQPGNDVTIFAPPSISHTIEPKQDDFDALSAKFDRFKSLYSQLRPEFEKAALS